MSKIEEIEGIGPAYAEKLRAADVATVESLLETAGPAAGRAALAGKTGIDAKLLLEWTNHADLFRLKGVASEYADLLEAAGVDSCPELAHRTADNLAAKLVEVNEAKHLVRSLPSAKTIAGWIDEAKTLPKVVTH